MDVNIMLRRVAVLLCFFVPCVVMADYEWPADVVCANMAADDELRCLCDTNYTDVRSVGGDNVIDRRTYVSDAVWASQKPYGYVLQVGRYDDLNYDGKKDDWYPYCTANMVRGKIVTANHCVKDGMRFRDGYGNEFSAHVDAEGGGVGILDWAILKPDNGVDISQNSIYKISKSNNMGRRNVTLSGFGGLKVMNDAEIRRFQQVYVVWLNAFYPLVDYIDEGAVSVNEGYGSYFLDDMTMSLDCRRYANDSMYKSVFEEFCLSNGKLKYSGFNYRACGLDYDDLFNDLDKLKTSTCTTGDVSKLNSGEAYITDCQSWGGTSGGGYYLSDDSILAIHTSGVGSIGAVGHASQGSKWGVFVETIKDKLPAVTTTDK